MFTRGGLVRAETTIHRIPMKTQTLPSLTHSLFALGLGCSLAVLPLQVGSAQESQPTAVTTPRPSDPGSVPSTNPGQPVQEDETRPTEPKHVKNNLTLAEKEFMRKAAGGNLAEVQMAQLALKNGESAQVKEFAQKMIDDHGMANKQLEQIAQDKGVLNFKPTLSEEDAALYARMGSMTGSAFDTAYIKHAVADHETDVKEYKTEEKKLKDADLKAYDEKTLPIIEGHLKMAKEMQATKTKAVNS